MAVIASSSLGVPNCLYAVCSVAAFISTTEFIFMTLSSCGLDLNYIRLASFSRVGDIMPQSLKSFARIALKHVSSTKQWDKRDGVELIHCLRVFLPTTHPGFSQKAGVGVSLVPEFRLGLGNEQAAMDQEVVTFSQGNCF